MNDSLQNSRFRMSDTARQLRRSVAEEPLTIPDVEALPSLRRVALETAEKAAAGILPTNGVSLSEGEIGGVPCLILTPEGPIDDMDMVYLFGGGFVQGSVYEDLPISAPLARLTKSRIICPQYRLAPEHPFPAALDDAFAVVSAVADQGRAPRLIGESAGGNLALSVTHRLRGVGLPGPDALALLSPACDISAPDESIELGLDPFLPQGRIAQVAQLYAEGRDLTDPEISPIFGLFDSDFPACFITTGTHDLLLSQCCRLASVIRRAGGDAELRVWDGLWHVFEFYPELPEAAASMEEIAGFLTKQAL